MPADMCTKPCSDPIIIQITSWMTGFRLYPTSDKEHYQDHTTHNCLECHQYADHARIINIRRPVSGIIHTLIGVSFCLKVQIQPAIAYKSIDIEIRCMYKS